MLHTFLEEPNRLRTRAWLFQIHLWMGLLLGLYMAVLLILVKPVGIYLVQVMEGQDCRMLRIGAPFSSRWSENRGAPSGTRLPRQSNFSQLQSPIN